MKENMIEYLLKHSKKRDKELKYDFMPSLLEIIERPSHIGGKIIIYSLFSLLIVAVIWAGLSKIDVEITATGNVVPVGDVKVVQAYTSGQVKSINVSEGQQVKENELLMELDTDIINIDINQINYQISELNVQLDLYNKIQKGEDITQISEKYYDEKYRSLALSIIESENKYKNTLNRLKLEKSNKDIDYQMAVNKKEKYALSPEYGSEIHNQELIIQQYKILVDQAEADIQNLKIEHDSSLAKSIYEIKNKTTELSFQLEKTNFNQSFQKITSPINGYINSIMINTIGGVVSPTQQLLTIVPENAEVEMVCYVKNKDISDIDIGNTVDIKLEAYPFSKYGTIPGKVIFISPSSLVDKKLGSVYLIKVKIKNDNKNIDIKAGLTGTVEIKIGKRTVLSYFWDPIIEGFDSSLKEK